VLQTINASPKSNVSWSLKVDQQMLDNRAEVDFVSSSSSSSSSAAAFVDGQFYFFSCTPTRCDTKPELCLRGSNSGLIMSEILCYDQVETKSFAIGAEMPLPWSYAIFGGVQCAFDGEHEEFFTSLQTRWISLVKCLKRKGLAKRRLSLEKLDGDLNLVLCCSQLGDVWRINFHTPVSVSNLLPFDVFADGVLVASGCTKSFPGLLPGDVMRFTLEHMQQPSGKRRQLTRTRRSLVQTSSWRSFSTGTLSAASSSPSTVSTPVSMIQFENGYRASRAEMCAFEQFDVSSKNGGEVDEDAVEGVDIESSVVLSGLPMAHTLFARVWIRNDTNVSLITKVSKISRVERK